MKKRLRQILSLLCILSLVLGSACTGAAEAQKEARIVMAVWEDGSSADDERPDISVSFNGTGRTLTKDNQWSASIEVDAGTQGDWTWTAPEGYKIRSSRPDSTVTILTVTKEAAAVIPSLSAYVDWKDGKNAKGVRPESVRLALLGNNGQPCGEPKTAKAPGWTVTWENVPAEDAGGAAITYTVSQLESPGFYTKAVNGLTVTNTLQTGRLSLRAELSGVPEDADVSGLRLLLDGPDPSVHNVTLTYGQLAGGTYDFGEVLSGAYLVTNNNADLLAEGYIMDTANSDVSDAVYVSPGESAQLTFKYTWKLPENYEAEEDYDPTANTGNLHFQIWGPDPRTRPMDVTYAEFTNGRFELPDLVPGVYTVVELNAETLVDYYTLSSDSITGMTLNVEPGETGTAKLYNKYVPAPTPEPDAEFVDIPVTKTWNDNNDADGNRPDSITVRLFADGVEVDSHVLTAAEGWTYTFTGKPRYQEDYKTEIQYTVREDETALYWHEINGYNIVNHYSPEETSVSVSKIWNDTNNAQGTRPKSVAMMLYNGVTANAVHIAVLSEANGWTAHVDHLPTRVEGKPAAYYWKEQEVLGYTLESTNQQGSLTTFTNTVWTRPDNPVQGRKPKTPGDTVYIFEDYETPLGIEVVINHVGDCFD